VTPLEAQADREQQRHYLRGNQHLTTLSRLKLWRIADAMDYRMLPDTLEANLSHAQISEFFEWIEFRNAEREREMED